MMWKQWIQQFDWYSTAIQMDKKSQAIQAASLMCLDPEIIVIFKSYNLTETKQNDVKLIKEKFKAYSNPNLNTSFKRFNFLKTKQNENESFNYFLMRMNNC